MKIESSYLMSLPCFSGISADSTIGLLAVLVGDAAGEYAVYVSVVPLNIRDEVREGFEKHTARSGAKQTFKQAGYFFNGLDESKYRR